MDSKKIFSGLLLFAGLILLGATLLYFIGNILSGSLFITALTLTAIGFLGFPQLKGFSYTIWILVAVVCALFYPSAFITVGGFELKKVIVPFVQLTMFGMGAHMSFDDFKGVARMPKGVLIAICCHYTVMPLIGFLLSRMFNFPPEVAGGIILIGCVPSAMASNVMSYLAKANLPLAVTIGACSTILAPFITPFLMKFFGGQYVEVNVAHMMIDITNMIIIPVVAGFIFNMFYFSNEDKKTKIIQLSAFAGIILFTNLIMMWVLNESVTELLISFATSMWWFYFLPMATAMLLKRARHISRSVIEQGLSFVAMVGIVINTLVITAAGRDNLLQIGGLLIITCLIHNVSGFGIGYFTAKIFGLPEKDRRTLAFEVGMQNGGVATGIALKMGKVATLGLASAIFGPLQNLTGSSLANWFRKQPVSDQNENDHALSINQEAEFKNDLVG
ncbi:bile acid:sodium symporter family protein [Chitinophaga sp. MM2321]|uniref:bile acid:sodium symporter family protein n=1 Tax=Chitinophaga sp. MM2321 TaxID=3137178 RepID=UPI0032D5A723